MEHHRLDIPRSTPLAVQQWQGLIAINYAARAAGITRHMRVDEALKKCPDLRPVHVQTLGALQLQLSAQLAEHGQMTATCRRAEQCWRQGRRHGGDRPPAAEGLPGALPAGVYQDHDPPAPPGSQGTVAELTLLRQYECCCRRSCACAERTLESLPAAQGLSTTGSHTRGWTQATVEKASIDEVYMDVTTMVDEELKGRASSRAPNEVWSCACSGALLSPLVLC